MANKKISDLSAAAALTDADLGVVEQPGETAGTRSRKITLAGLAAYFLAKNDAPSDGNAYGRKNGGWVTVTGGGGGGSGAPWSLQFRPYDNEPPASNYATLDLRNNRPVLDFDDTTQETAVFSGVLPAGYAGGGITVTIFCSLTSAVSGTVGWDVALERTQASTDDIDSDSFATAKTVTAVTVPGTSGQVLAMSVNLASGAEMDSLAAGELFRLRVRRDVASDNAVGDAELLAVSIKEQ